MTSPHDSKAALRRVLRETRPAVEAQHSQSAEIRRVLREWLARQPARTIASFAAIPGEPLLLPLLAELPDRRWVLPRVDRESMGFHFVGLSPAALQPGAFGIPEPPDDATPCPLAQIELFLCPGMAFTPGGKRLGRGKGFFDRALAAADPESLRVGVCFLEQVHPELPAAPHDVPMHFLATPAGVMDCAE